MSLKRWADEVVRPAVPVALPRLAFLNSTPLDDGKELAVELATQFNEKRIIRRGVDAWAVVKKAESFEGWKAIGAALAIGRKHALETSGASAAIGRRYSAAFSAWLDQTGFPQMSKPLRSWTLDLNQNILAVLQQWRAPLTDRERKRLTNPQSIVRRWRKDTAPIHKAGGAGSPLRTATAAWGRFVVSVRALSLDDARPLWRAVYEEAARSGVI